MMSSGTCLGDTSSRIVRLILSRSSSVSSDPSAIVFQKTYRAKNRPTSRKSPSIVKAWNAGLAEILRELEADLAKVDRSPRK